jgi:hypothetical protein
MPFKILLISLLGFLSKYECWVTDLIMPLYHFCFVLCVLGEGEWGSGVFVILFCGIGRDELQDKKG